jgi:hypothetical protein
MFMDSSVTESSKAEEVILPEIRFLTPAELDSLRANAEELKKGPDQVSPLPCFAVRKPWVPVAPSLFRL